MKHWPLVKVLPVRTHFKFVRLGKYFGVLSAVLILLLPGISVYSEIAGMRLSESAKRLQSTISREVVA